jgi:ribosomal protein S18 acetylase RimI-like enzyme
MPEAKTYTHYLTGKYHSKDLHKHALGILRSHCPISLPLYRRLQFGHFHDTAVLLTNIPNLGLNNTNSSPPDEPWFLAFVDRASRPASEVWFFASWESSPSPPSPETEIQEHIDALLLNLYRTIKALETPESVHQDVLDAMEHDPEASENSVDSAGYTRADYIGHGLDSDIMLWASIHERTVFMMQRLNVLTGMMVVPNHMFLWDVDNLPRYDERPLPEGLRWGELGREHFALVRSRTQIPRQDRTLALLPNVGIFEEKSGKPVSWVFGGQDASLTTLHVESEYRRKGFAKAVSAKLFREKMDLFWEEGMPRFGHGYVVDGNKESEGMCRSMGGESRWHVYWIRVGLKLVQ